MDKSKRYHNLEDFLADVKKEHDVPPESEEVLRRSVDMQTKSNDIADLCAQVTEGNPVEAIGVLANGIIQVAKCIDRMHKEHKVGSTLEDQFEEIQVTGRAIKTLLDIAQMSGHATAVTLGAILVTITAESMVKADKLRAQEATSNPGGPNQIVFEGTSTVN